MKKNIVAIVVIMLFQSFTIWGQATIGGSTEPRSGVLLDLKEYDSDGTVNSSKGMSLPRVELQVQTSLAPLRSGTTGTEEKLKYKGTMVYNVTTNEYFKEGVYFWDGTQWNGMDVKVPQKTAQTVYLATNYLTYTGDKTGGGYNVFLQFDASIQIPEDGPYAFCFKLFGEINGLSSQVIHRCSYYISLWVENELKDIAEIDIFASDPYWSSNNSEFTYTVTLGGSFTKGDNVKVKLTNPDKMPQWHIYGGNTHNKSERTSMFWWNII